MTTWLLDCWWLSCILDDVEVLIEGFDFKEENVKLK